MDLDGFEPSTSSMPWKSADAGGYPQSPERALETQSPLFPICRRIPELEVPSSVPVSHAVFSMGYQISLLSLLRLCCADSPLARGRDYLPSCMNLWSRP